MIFHSSHNSRTRVIQWNYQQAGSRYKKGYNSLHNVLICHRTYKMLSIPKEIRQIHREKKIQQWILNKMSVLQVHVLEDWEISLYIYPLSLSVGISSAGYYLRGIVWLHRPLNDAVQMLVKNFYTVALTLNSGSEWQRCVLLRHYSLLVEVCRKGLNCLRT